MKRLATAVLIIALTLFFGIKGERGTERAADRLYRGAQELRGLCVEYGPDADLIRERASELWEGWREDAGKLSLHMNARNLRPVTQALRDIKQAAADGDAEKLGDALRQLGDVVDDMRESESLGAENVF